MAKPDANAELSVPTFNDQSSLSRTPFFKFTLSYRSESLLYSPALLREKEGSFFPSSGVRRGRGLGKIKSVMNLFGKARACGGSVELACKAGGSREVACVSEECVETSGRNGK